MNLILLNAESNPLTKPAIILRDLWKALELKERYQEWSSRQLEDFTQGIDFKEVQVNLHQGNGTFLSDHAVTIEVAKHIALMSRTENGKRYRQKLIELEESTNTPKIPKTYNEAIKALANSIIENEKLLLESAEKESIITKQAPMVSMYKTTLDTSTTRGLREVVGLLKPHIKERELSNLLLEKEWTYRTKNGKTKIYASTMDAGYMKYIEILDKDGVPHMANRFTRIGIAKIAEYIGIHNDSEFVDRLKAEFE